MALLKKLTFAPFFLIIFFILIYSLKSFLGSYDFIFSLSTATLIQLITVSVLIILSSFLFTLTATIAPDWKIVIPLSLIAALIPLFFLNFSLGIVFAVAIFISLLLSFANLENKLKTYLNFEPISLLGPSIRNLSFLLILSFTLVFFLSINKTISEQSFQIPDSIIDTALKFAQTDQQETPAPQLPPLSKDQIDLLRKNPELLKQSSLDPKILDNLGKNLTQAPQNLANDLIKQTVKDQLQGLIKPYLGFVPAILSVLLFLTLQSLTSILNLLVYPLLWLTFFILEKSGFTKFIEETRVVKKMVI